MSREQNEQLVRDYLHWLEQAGNAASGVTAAQADTFLAPNFMSHTGNVGRPSGPTAVLDAIREMQATFSAVQFRVDQVAVGDDGVMLSFTLDGTLKDGGDTVSEVGIAHYLIAKGRITGHWRYDVISHPGERGFMQAVGGGISDLP